LKRGKDKQGSRKGGSLKIELLCSSMTVFSMTFLTPQVNGDDLTNFISQIVRVTGKALNHVFDGEDVELTLETPDGRLVKVIKAGVSMFLVKT
jgi:hypothetical protein